MLMLIVRISDRVEKRGGYHPLGDTRFIKKILADDKMKSLEMKYRHEDFPFQHPVASLAETIKESGLYKNYIKDSGTDKGDDDRIWEKIVNLIILPNPALNSAMSTRDNFTLRGVERMKGMLSDTFKNFYASRDNIDDALKTLSLSMMKARELYFRLLLLPVELCLSSGRINWRRTATNTSPPMRGLNPNMRFVENGLAAVIASNPTFQEFCEKNKTSWIADDRIMLEALLKQIMESEIYADYMDFPATDFSTDCEFGKMSTSTSYSIIRIFLRQWRHNPYYGMTISRS